MRENKSDRFEMRLTPNQRQEFDAIAKLAGVSVSGLIIGAILGDLAGDAIIKLRDQLNNSSKKE